MKSYPTTILASYSELVQRLQDDEIIQIGGNPVKRKINERYYWYTITYIGRKQVERYLGPDNEEMHERVERLKQQKQDLKLREKQRGKLVRILREAGLPSPDLQTGKTMSALSQAGVFRLRGVLVGTHAYRCYPAILGMDLGEAAAVTEDIDIAQFRPVSVAIGDHVDPEIKEALEAVGDFRERPSLHEGKPTSWSDRVTGTVVELLTPNQGNNRDVPMKLPSLGVHAQPLRFLDYLIYDPIPAAMLYRYGILVNVPRPTRYAVHKLIVAVRRRADSSAKAEKDIRQAAELIEALAEIRPDELEEAWTEAQARGKRWANELKRGARRLPERTANVLKDLVSEQM